MTYYIYKDDKGLWCWYLKAADGRKIAHSCDSYNDQQDCVSAIGSVRNTYNAPIYEE